MRANVIKLCFKRKEIMPSIYKLPNFVTDPQVVPKIDTFPLAYTESTPASFSTGLISWVLPFAPELHLLAPPHNGLVKRIL